MLQISEIRAAANGEPCKGLSLVYVTERTIPNSIHYSIKRFEKSAAVRFEDSGMLEYAIHPQKPAENRLTLRYCVAGNMYCNDAECAFCTIGNMKNCRDSADCVDLVQAEFTPAQLLQFGKAKPGAGLSEEVLYFRHPGSFSQTVPVCSKIRSIVEGLVNHQYSGSLENIFVNAQLHMLLLLSIHCLEADAAPAFPECKFLNNPADKEKVSLAREFLIRRIGEPITIKELSRKVAMNECYLKKGFKEMYGSTIFDFYQHQRMEHAKYLLYEKGMSVTDVSIKLGYSSISHFSTAFKKQTGLKPCELLLRS